MREIDRLRWTRHLRIGGRHFGIALYEPPGAGWLEHYFQIWTRPAK